MSFIPPQKRNDVGITIAFALALVIKFRLGLNWHMSHVYYFTTDKTSANPSEMNDSAILDALEKNSKLKLSLKQHSKIFRCNGEVVKAFSNDTHKICPINHGRFFAYGLTESFAFRHVFKNGGTTVGRQTKRPPGNSSMFRNYSLVATVRDPIDHFLSGWAECGKRGSEEAAHFQNDFSTLSYDERILQWLIVVKENESKCKSNKCCIHSYPQVNFLSARKSNLTFSLDPRITVIGDLKELPHLLEFVGFAYNLSIPSGRTAASDQLKNEKFPKRRNLISNRTCLELCRFLILDYFLLDYPLPPACEALQEVTSKEFPSCNQRSCQNKAVHFIRRSYLSSANPDCSH